jgi:hypothetical protein
MVSLVGEDDQHDDEEGILFVGRPRIPRETTILAQQTTRMMRITVCNKN